MNITTLCMDCGRHLHGPNPPLHHLLVSHGLCKSCRDTRVARLDELQEQSQAEQDQATNYADEHIGEIFPELEAKASAPWGDTFDSLRQAIERAAQEADRARADFFAGN